MTLKRKHVLVGLFVLILMSAGGYYWPTTIKLQHAPDVDFKIVDGRTLSLRDLKGRPVLVVFWATSCASCIRELPHLIQLYDELAPDGLEIIGVAMAYDPPNQVMEMRRRKQIPYPIALDVEAKIAGAFGDVRLTPMTFLIAPNGKVAIQKTGILDMTNIKQKIQSMLPVSQGEIIMLYLWVKAFHLIFMVTWFAGLFYLPRLFVYHAMAEDLATREHLKVMERKLYRFVTPLMWLMLGFGLWLIYLNGWSWFISQTWLQIKLILVVILIGYHFYCGKIVTTLLDDGNLKTHVYYRWFNEIPVLFLFAIVILAVIKKPVY